MKKPFPDQFDDNGKLLPKHPCPCCNAPNSAAAGTNHNARPRPGDLSVCVSCASLLVFNEDMTVREMLLNDLMGLDDATRTILFRTQKEVQAYNEAH